MWKRCCTGRLNRKIIIYVICALLPIILLPLATSPSKESRCGYVLILVAIYWMLEPVPTAVTALLPCVLFPLLGVVSSAEISASYMKEIILIFTGGYIVAIAVEDSMLHKRVALKVLLIIGTEIKWLMFGLMLTTMFLSMWINNAAITIMMIPIVDAIIEKISSKTDGTFDGRSRECVKAEDLATVVTVKTFTVNNKDSGVSAVKTTLLLSVCYAANIGGTGSLLGAGTNMIFKGLIEEIFPESETITFANWMMYSVPGMVLCVLIAWLYLWLVHIRCSKKIRNIVSKDSIRETLVKKYTNLGPMTCHEVEVLFFFLLLVFLWLFRKPEFIPGWADAIGSETKIGDSVPSIAVAFLLFFIPSDIRNWNSRPILEWKTAQAKLPWGVNLLVGGGFALANGTQKSGLSSLLGQKLKHLDVLSPGAIVTIICVMTAMVTEILSNVITATILLPVFSQMAVSSGTNPLYLTIPVATVCSYAFMLPVATVPNAIVFEHGHMRTIDMVKPGFAMNLICCSVQLLMLNTLGIAMFDLNTFPSWANISGSQQFQNQTISLIPQGILNSNATRIV